MKSIKISSYTISWPCYQRNNIFSQVDRSSRNFLPSGDGQSVFHGSKVIYTRQILKFTLDVDRARLLQQFFHYFHFQMFRIDFACIEIRRFEIYLNLWHIWVRIFSRTFDYFVVSASMPKINLE